MILFGSRQKLMRWTPATLVTVAMACLLVPFASAQAATRYAAPDGSAANSPCTVKASPCDIRTAMNTSLQEGETLLLAPGTYQPTGSLQTAHDSVTIAGEPGEPAPLVKPVGGHGLWIQGASSTVRDVRIKAPREAEEGLFMLGEDNLAERVEVSGEADWGCVMVSGTVRDSLCASTRSDGGSGLHTDYSSAAPVTKAITLSNVTAIGTASGIEFRAGSDTTLNLHVLNTIAVGEENDIYGSAEGPTGRLDIDLSHSNFAEVFTEGEEISVTSPNENGNQSALPLFVDPATGNYAEQSSSPTRFAGGLAALLPGELDLDGNPRTTDCEGVVGVDIGAYQLTDCPPPAGGGGGSGGGSSSGGGPGGGSTSGGGSTMNPTPPPPAPVAPKLTKLALKPSKFEGKTALTFTLSATAKVKLEVLKKKKQTNGKTKTVKVGTLPQVSGSSGSNKVSFNGKLKGKKLAAGKYTLRATATASGLSSKPRTTAFEVLS
jgi:uncharacterized membrane protein YgcG